LVGQFLDHGLARLGIEAQPDELEPSWERDCGELSQASLNRFERLAGSFPL